MCVRVGEFALCFAPLLSVLVKVALLLLLVVMLVVAVVLDGDER